MSEPTPAPAQPSPQDKRLKITQHFRYKLLGSSRIQQLMMGLCSEVTRMSPDEQRNLSRGRYGDLYSQLKPLIAMPNNLTKYEKVFDVLNIRCEDKLNEMIECKLRPSQGDKVEKCGGTVDRYMSCLDRTSKNLVLSAMGAY